MISINRPKLPNTVITSQLLRLQFEFCQKKIVEGLSLCVLDFNSTHKSKIFTTQPFTEKVCKPLKLTTISVLHTGMKAEVHQLEGGLTAKTQRGS